MVDCTTRWLHVRAVRTSCIQTAPPPSQNWASIGITLPIYNNKEEAVLFVLSFVSLPSLLSYTNDHPVTYRSRIGLRVPPARALRTADAHHVYQKRGQLFLLSFRLKGCFRLLPWVSKCSRPRGTSLIFAHLLLLVVIPCESYKESFYRYALHHSIRAF